MSMPSEGTKIAVLLRTARTALGWSQQEFADLLGVAKSTVARIETLEVGARGELLMKAVSLFNRHGVSIDIGEGLRVDVGVEALLGAQARLEDEAMRRSDRKRPGGGQQADAEEPPQQSGDKPSGNNPLAGSW